jgi:hypothetical protein
MVPGSPQGRLQADRWRSEPFPAQVIAGPMPATERALEKEDVGKDPIVEVSSRYGSI